MRRKIFVSYPQEMLVAGDDLHVEVSHAAQRRKRRMTLLLYIPWTLLVMKNRSYEVLSREDVVFLSGGERRHAWTLGCSVTPL